MSNNPITGLPGVTQATATRINELDQVIDANISESMVMAIDFPTETLKVTWLQLKNALVSQANPVGTVILRGNDVDPNASMPGTWVVKGAGHSLQAVAIGNGAGTVGGDNDVIVPVPEHAHAASFVGDEMAPHNHTLSGQPIGEGGNRLNVSTGPNGDSTGIDAASAGTPAGAVRTTKSMAQASEDVTLTSALKYVKTESGKSVSVGDTTITLTTTKTALFTVGDYILLEDLDNDVMINRVKSISGAVLTLVIASTVALTGDTDYLHILTQVEAKLI